VTGCDNFTFQFFLDIYVLWALFAEPVDNTQMGTVQLYVMKYGQYLAFIMSTT
jgi:hypothetical protein